MTTDMLALNCWILGEDPGQGFCVRIASSKTVALLRNAIKEENPHTFDGIDANELRLWKVSDIRFLIPNTVSDTLQGQDRLGEALSCTRDNQGRRRHPRW